MVHRSVDWTKESEPGNEIIVSDDQPRAGSVRSAFRSGAVAADSITHSEIKAKTIDHFIAATL